VLTAWMGATASKEVSKASRTWKARIGAALTVRKSALRPSSATPTHELRSLFEQDCQPAHAGRWYHCD